MMANRRAARFPVTEPTGLRREQAAMHCGSSAGHFDRMVKEGFLPQPRDLDGVKVWLRQELDQALFALSVAGNERKEDKCEQLFV